MDALRQAAQDLLDKIYDLGASPLDWPEHSALEAALAAPEQAQAVEPEFWDWIKKAYREPHDKFTIYNMEVAFQAGKAQQVAVPEPMSDFDLRGVLASNLLCWHRLTEAEAQDLTCFFEKVHTAEAKQAQAVDAMKATPEDMLVYRNIAKQAQQVAVPELMTDKQIKDVVWGYVEDSSNIPEHIVGIIRAAEAHHGIGAKP